MLTVTAFLSGVERPSWVQGGMQGLSAAGLALLFLNLVQALPSGRGIRRAWLIGALAFVGNGMLELDILPVLVCLTLLSLAFNYPQRS